MNLRITGLYDSRTLKSLLDLEVSSVTFDFRPKSLNFIQHYKVLEILKECGLNSKMSYHFLFDNESKLLIEKFIVDVNSQHGITCSDWKSHRLQLEFSGRSDFSALDDFNVPYTWHYNSHCPDVKLAQNLVAVVFQFSFFEEALENGTIGNLCQNLHTLFYRFEFKLERDWDSNVFPSLFELFDFSEILLPVNFHVESCFRNVDLVRLKDHVSRHIER